MLQWKGGKQPTIYVCLTSTKSRNEAMGVNRGENPARYLPLLPEFLEINQN
jgi:hypothetical protein